MSVRLQVEQKETWVAVRLFGTAEIRKLPKRYKELADICERANKKKLLVDITATDVPLSTFDKYEMGEHATIFTLHRIKVAVVAKVDQIDPQRFGELVATNRGADLRLFTDLQSAEEWLR